MSTRSATAFAAWEVQEMSKPNAVRRAAEGADSARYHVSELNREAKALKGLRAVGEGRIAWAPGWTVEPMRSGYGLCLRVDSIDGRSSRTVAL